MPSSTAYEDLREIVQVATFPKHFHDGSEDNVVASHISSDPPQAMREFCRFIRMTLRNETTG